uniref:Uncharacterized protein n=1 Tax=Arundo donax TaxID=35708 RepID=A0A0A9FL87_ARUDO
MSCLRTRCMVEFGVLGSEVCPLQFGHPKRGFLYIIGYL